uniref:Uncharacterized protein n=1 Tax=Tanacetum cinerariifolium TaxID=118510 RepID=A0A699GW10_TANCI|nr:hypothetical protein [Tanacetum cinerariifolium]
MMWFSRRRVTLSGTISVGGDGSERENASDGVVVASSNGVFPGSFEPRLRIPCALKHAQYQTLRTPREERYERRESKKRECEEEVESIMKVQSFRSKKPKMRVIIPTERILVSGLKVNFKIRRNMRN